VRIPTGIRYSNAPWRWRDIPAYFATTVYNPQGYLSNFELQALCRLSRRSPGPIVARSFSYPSSRLIDPPPCGRRGIFVRHSEVLRLGRGQHVLHHARAEGWALTPCDSPLQVGSCTHVSPNRSASALNFSEPSSLIVRRLGAWRFGHRDRVTSFLSDAARGWRRGWVLNT